MCAAAHWEEAITACVRNEKNIGQIDLQKALAKERRFAYNKANPKRP
jgi:hypothetical protein